jgi:DNA-binding FrmR family transcriptional regulator
MKNAVALKNEVVVKIEAAKLDAGPPTAPVNTGNKERTLKRLRRIEGQVRGLQGMVDKERYCADILEQIASVHEALRAVARELMRDHLKQSAAHALRSGPKKTEAAYDELIELVQKYVR